MAIPYPLPQTLNIKRWENYLGRRLDDEEYSLIEAVKSERDYNRNLIELFERTKSKGFYIPKLTERDGNCLFESLEIIGLCDDKDDFRRFLAYMMYVYKNKKNFLKFDDRSLCDMFNDTNEIEYVLCNEETIVYKYTYDTMCQDLANGSSWTRLPTQIIILFISSIMNVRFEIFNNQSDYVTVLDANESISKDTIYLGHLGEKHYVPLEIRTGNPNDDIVPKYTECIQCFKQWAKQMESLVNGINDQVFHENNESSNRTDDNTRINRNTMTDFVEIPKISNYTNGVDYE